MGLTPQDRAAAKRDDGKKHLVLSGSADSKPREEHLTDAEHRRRLRERRDVPDGGIRIRD